MRSDHLILPGTGRGTTRSVMEGFTLATRATWRRFEREPLHHSLRERSPSPCGGGCKKGSRLQ